MAEQGRHNRRRRRPLHPSQRSRRRQGEFGFGSGFWNDANIEQDFFSTRNYDNNNHYYPVDPPQTNPYSPPNTYNNYNYNRQPAEYRPQPSIPQNYNDYNNGYNRNAYNVLSATPYLEEPDNDILGSGNFEVISGGTFYDKDTYYDLSYNRRPNYYSNGDIFENFRDFADIKNEAYRYK